MVAALVFLVDSLESGAQGHWKKPCWIIAFIMTICLPTPTPHTHAAADQPLRGRRFLWLLVPPWDNVWTRQNHFTTRLAQLGAEVLYVENSFATSTLLKHGELGRRVFCPSNTFKEKAPGLTVMTPPPMLPGG